MAFAAIAALAFGLGAYAAEPASAPGKPMKMDDPMPTKMKKPGMKQGDVMRAAEKKRQEMAPMLEQESAAGKK